MHVTMKRCAAILAIVAGTTTALDAQQARVGPKWQGWIGCWTASPAGESAYLPAPATGPLVCITPATSGDAADVTTIDNGKVVATQHIDASGAERPVEAKGCTGVQRGNWSADERRIYLHSSSTCDGLKSTTSAILGMSALGEWLDVRGVSSYGNENVRVARYRDAGIPASVPEQIAGVLRDQSGSREAARLAAGANIGPTAVIEASRAADSSVVAAWLLEREQKFDVDAKTLVQLAKAGVPGAVTDALVVVSNPGVFHLARATQPSVYDDSTLVGMTPQQRRRVSAMAIPYDPWSWGYLGYGGYPIGYGYGRYGYGSYGGYGYGYNTGGYGAGGYYGGYVPPIIVVTSPQAQSHGQMVKGRGYTQTQGGSTGTATERPRSSYQPPPPSTSTSSGSSSSSSGRSSTSGSERTAKPKN